MPPSTVSLKVRDVRTTDPLFPGGSGAGQITEVQLTEVIGLVAELAVRVVKGPGYANSRTAVINDTGQIEGALGAPGDCVRVDGSSGPCGGGATFVDQEVPAGTVDGANAVFTIANAPTPSSSLHLYRNGLLQKVGFDFSITGQAITFVTAAVPQAGDTLLASYRR